LFVTVVVVFVKVAYRSRRNVHVYRARRSKVDTGCMGKQACYEIVDDLIGCKLAYRSRRNVHVDRARRSKVNTGCMGKQVEVRLVHDMIVCDRCRCFRYRLRLRLDTSLPSPFAIGYSLFPQHTLTNAHTFSHLLTPTRSNSFASTLPTRRCSSISTVSVVCLLLHFP
jgi:hypothetical protein